MMSSRFVLACALALAAPLAFAQAPAAPAEKPAAAQDCVKPHDHGAERQAPTPGKGCKPAAKVAKAKPQAKGKSVEGHDHGKVHKNN